MDIDTIKKDLLEKITTDKYYLEAELLRMVKSENIEYKEKINKISDVLSEIALSNTKIQLIKQYFQKK